MLINKSLVILFIINYLNTLFYIYIIQSDAYITAKLLLLLYY